MKEVVYKDQIFHLLMLLLEQARIKTRDQDCTYKAMSKWLKFQTVTDWKRYQSAIHLLGDTEQAIASAFKYQLGDESNRNSDWGETQLRLYGVLNAVYLQISAYQTIMNLLNFPTRQEAIKSFYKLDIYKLRGMVGAHTIDYLYDEDTLKNSNGVSKTTSFSILQYCLDKTGERIELIDKNGLHFSYNLLKVLFEYESMATELLIKLIKYSIEKYYKGEDKQDMNKRLESLLPNLINYSSTDQNKKHRDELSAKIGTYIKTL